MISNGSVVEIDIAESQWKVCMGDCPQARRLVELKLAVAMHRAVVVGVEHPEL